MQNANLSVLFLAGATMPVWVGIIVAIAAAAVAVLVYVLVNKATTEKKLGSADERAKEIVAQAQAEADKIIAQGKEESKRALKEALQNRSQAHFH